MIIITGGAGFIGSCLLADLNAAGLSDILVVDHLGTGSKWKNLVGKHYSDFLSKDDFRDLFNSGAELGEVSTVFHLGACSSTTEKDADYLMDNNYRYSKELFLWSKEVGARFIYASSGATYGDGAQGYSDASVSKNKPLNMYGYSKQLFDEWLVLNSFDSEAVGIKFFNVYGPNEYHKGEMASVAYKQFSSVQMGNPIKLFRSFKAGYKDGEQKRDFIYVKDCIKVLRFFQENTEQNGIFNLGTGNARSWNDLAKSLFMACKKNEQIEYIDMPKELQGKYQYFTEAKVEKLRAVGYTEPFFTLEDGVKDYVENYLIPEGHL
jgi:ADP-L-glycero-D-manno-heptose 6-epimerase